MGKVYLSCSITGKCCYGTIPLTRDEFIKFYRDLILGIKIEVDTAAHYNSIKFKDLYVSFSLAFSSDFNTKCNFLKEDGRCSIYEDRPLICRFYPLSVSSKGNRILGASVIGKECLNCGGRNCFSDKQSKESVLLLKEGKPFGEFKKLMQMVIKEAKIQKVSLFEPMLRQMKKQIPEKNLYKSFVQDYLLNQRGKEVFLDILANSIYFFGVYPLLKKRNVDIDDFFYHQRRLRKEAIERGELFKDLYKKALENSKIIEEKIKRGR